MTASTDNLQGEQLKSRELWETGIFFDSLQDLLNPYLYYLFTLHVQFVNSIRQSHPSISLLFLNTVVNRYLSHLNSNCKKEVNKHLIIQRI